MEELILVGAGAGAAFVGRVVFDWIKGKNGNGKIPTECKMKLDSLIGDHDRQKDYMQEQRTERTQQTMYLKQMVEILAENGKRLEKIIRIGK